MFLKLQTNQNLIPILFNFESVLTIELDEKETNYIFYFDCIKSVRTRPLSIVAEQDYIYYKYIVSKTEHKESFDKITNYIIANTFNY